MRKTILRIIWPYVLRYLAQRSADYLDQRREQKRQLKEAATIRPGEQGTAAEEYKCPPLPKRLSTANAVWYTLGGILLGSAMGLILASVFREEG